MAGETKRLKPMDAPRCIACGTRHWSRQPCPAAATRQDKARAILATVGEPVKTETVKTIAPVKTDSAPVKTAVKTGFDKKTWMKTYMRDYMRKRRAKAP
jgi:hypothetical protein